MLLRFQELNSVSHAKAIVLLHGMFGMSDNLLNLAQNLAKDYHVIIPDLINHGKSPHRDEMTYPLMARDVMAVLDHLKIEHFSIMGHSMGGKVAMQIAHDYSDRVNQLIVADIAPVDYPSRHKKIIAAMFAVKNQQITQRREADHILAMYIPEAPLRQFFMKNMHKTAEGCWTWRFGIDEIAAAYPHLCAAPVLRHPVIQNCLFIKGGGSDYITEEHLPIIRRYFSNPSFKIIDKAGHWLHAEKPQIFNRLVINFFSAKE